MATYLIDSDYCQARKLATNEQAEIFGNILGLYDAPVPPTTKIGAFNPDGVEHVWHAFYVLSNLHLIEEFEVKDGERYQVEAYLADSHENACAMMTQLALDWCATGKAIGV